MAEVVISSQNTAPAPLVVRIMREPFSPFFMLAVISGMPAQPTEDLSPDEARLWLTERGADKEAVEKALDYVWNMYGFRKKVLLNIHNPREPKRSKFAPKI
jgi:hypothetical protein